MLLPQPGQLVAQRLDRARRGLRVALRSALLGLHGAVAAFGSGRRLARRCLARSRLPVSRRLSSLLRGRRRIPRRLRLRLCLSGRRFVRRRLLHCRRRGRRFGLGRGLCRWLLGGRLLGSRRLGRGTAPVARGRLGGFALPLERLRQPGSQVLLQTLVAQAALRKSSLQLRDLRWPVEPRSAGGWKGKLVAHK